ncbi:MAG: glycosyl hydrolase family 18 protein [Desulfitobacteriaceae bacterium]
MNILNLVPSAQHLLEKRLWILGYIAEDFPGDIRSIETLKQHGSSIDTYADFAFRLHSDASFTGHFSEPALEIAHNQDIAPLMLFHNFNGQIFDPQPLRSVLANEVLRQRCIENILKSLPRFTAGVHIDFEGVEASYRVAYLSFLDSLSATLHNRGLLLTIAIPAKRSKWEAPGYDFAEIGRICDAITIMTYDEHYAGGPSGPIASLPWMTQALDYAISLIPREKILLGIPVYGYDWSNIRTTMVPMRDIPTLTAKTQARVLWSDPAVEPYFYYWQGRDKHTVWFENETSTKIRFGFVKTYRIRGIAIWRFGYETRSFWQGLTTKFKIK